MNRLDNFLIDDCGAVTIDWVALTSAILIMAIMVVYAIYNNGVSSEVDNVNNLMTDLTSEVSFETVSIGGSTIHNTGN